MALSAWRNASKMIGSASGAIPIPVAVIDEAAELRAQQEIGIAQDDVEGRAELVRHGGDELRLETTGAVQLLHDAGMLERHRGDLRDALRDPPVGLPKRLRATTRERDLKAN